MFAFFEDRRAPQGEPAAWLFTDLIECREVFDADGWAATLADLERQPGWTVAALDYELGYLFEPKSAPLDWQAGVKPLARFWRFADCQTLDEQEAEAWLEAQLAGATAGVLNVQPAIDEKTYTSAVHRIQSLISAGDCYQVNDTFPLTFDWFGSPLALYARLRRRQPVRYGGFVGDTAQGIVSLSPELFLEKRGDKLTTRPMKGTAPRTAAPETLRDSVKDRAENLMIVDLLRNDLGRVAENGSVRVERLFEIEDYPTVWQMVSEVSAAVPGRSLADILRALFPCGSITGAPKIRAMQIAGELESEPRGLYTGALGWLAPNGDFRLNVAIRTLQLAANYRGSLGVGSGIVADSRADAEWRECLLKARFLTDCDPGIQLIETMRLEVGGLHRRERHLARLANSAGALGFPVAWEKLEAALGALPSSGKWRVRLTLNKTGIFEAKPFALTDEPAGPRFARLADTAIDSRYPLRRHKTTDRAVYDAALVEVMADPTLFDVVFLNERGEVAEGARSNVFVERDGVLLTPPLASGALPGILREELLATGRAREAILLPVDLADGFWLGNSLRGLIRVSWR
ncbi:aminodeoxychorismate synthase component I [Azonexus sp. IMCC34839]|uniref:aminodeoxychorismate synthase component I n=1 Tax=Azonexus sp. IMCC34839 TaxID=3133695 RepID=UPI00399A914D